MPIAATVCTSVCTERLPTLLPLLFFSGIFLNQSALNRCTASSTRSNVQLESLKTGWEDVCVRWKPFAGGSLLANTYQFSLHCAVTSTCFTLQGQDPAIIQWKTQQSDGPLWASTLWQWERKTPFSQDETSSRTRWGVQIRKVFAHDTNT